jgi:hypothetical protein
MLPRQPLTLRSNYIKIRGAILPGLLGVKNKDRRELTGPELDSLLSLDPVDDNSLLDLDVEDDKGLLNVDLAGENGLVDVHLNGNPLNNVGAGATGLLNLQGLGGATGVQILQGLIHR